MEVNRDEVREYLKDVKRSVKNGRYQISPREKNQELYIEYAFSEEKCENIILTLETEDFSEAVQNDHPQHPEEILYIFGKDVKLLPKQGGAEKIVPLYIKFNKLKDFYIIVISFHEQDFPLKYMFK